MQILFGEPGINDFQFSVSVSDFLTKSSSSPSQAHHLAVSANWLPAAVSLVTTTFIQSSVPPPLTYRALSLYLRVLTDIRYMYLPP